MRFTIDGLREISWWVCGYAEEVVVNKPKELAELVATRHRQAAAVYDA
jgi:predicted DNA-binding transcriptional regulator YafY